jgi:hypothetical protein
MTATNFLLNFDPTIGALTCSSQQQSNTIVPIVSEDPSLGSLTDRYKIFHGLSFEVDSAGGELALLSSALPGLDFGSAGVLQWSATTAPGAPDIQLTRSGASTLRLSEKTAGVFHRRFEFSDTGEAFFNDSGAGQEIMKVSIDNAAIQMGNGTGIQWFNDTDIRSSSADVIIAREGTDNITIFTHSPPERRVVFDRSVVTNDTAMQLTYWDGAAFQTKRVVRDPLTTVLSAP